MANEFDIQVTQTDVTQPTLLFRVMKRVVDVLHTVGIRIVKIESIIKNNKAFSLEEIKKALQAGGSNTLSVDNLPGILGQPQPAGITVYTSTPPQNIIQTLRDKQLVLVTGSPDKLQYVNAANPSSLNDINTAPADMMTTDTDQTVTGTKSWTSGQINSSSQFGCSVAASSSQAIPTAVGTAITFNTESFDRGPCHDNATNNTRITVPTGGAGIWLFVGQIQWASNATGYRKTYIKSNGANIIASQEYLTNTVAAEPTFQNIFTLSSVADADYFELFGAQSSGGNLNAVAGGGSTFFQAIKLF
jgi:hypothetical protein